LCHTDQYHQMDHQFRYPLQHITNTSHPGSLPLRRSFLELSRNLVLSGMKRSEDGQDLVLHVYEADGKAGQAWLSVKDLDQIRAVNILERDADLRLEQKDGRTIFEVKPNELLIFRCGIN
ncbi:MAG: hypothetical protein EOM13_10610, partial [Clostridia bacterium]|nr:hypothetical protein [Clostridia bacterium]